jgi:hypothetical protein
MSTQFTECIFLHIQQNNIDRLLVGLIYRSPSDSDSCVNHEKLRSLITESVEKGFTHYLIMGDFNYLDINWSTWNTKVGSCETQEYQFMECIQDNFLFQHVDKPTRWRGGYTPSVLDRILTNEENMVANLEYQSPL